MIFSKPIAGKVARGEATLTIRPATTRPPAHGARRCVKVTQKGAIACHITITDVEELLAGEVTFKQARACGYRTTDEFREAWVQTYDRAWLASMDEDGGHVVEPVQRARFELRHARTPCYAISFTLAVDTPRFLAKPGPNQGDYTEQRHRAIDDLEVVDEMTQERYAKAARAAGERQRASFRRELEEERARREAKRRPMWRSAA